MGQNLGPVSLLFAGPQGILSQSWAFVPGMTVGSLRTQPNLMPALAQAWDAGLVRARFGSVVNDHQALEPWDRIDLLRPLLADPKEARRKRVESLRAQRAREGQTDRWTKNRG
ncbi:MAG: RnfH family Ubiquitin [Pseudomonadota bacterium]|jgi:putative ubiquitin-RnfH superfamily antitoxin RatB of RatAB toxin-antitoxin module